VLVKNVIAGLVRNKIKYGYAYCPCREVKGTPEQDRTNICPCHTHKKEIADQGTCECGLFVSEVYFNTKRR
ncbi:MAG: ferredoxin-thioredoxin reductase catalytic domain-containing protein, partial [Bacteroidota bacterium]